MKQKLLLLFVLFGLTIISAQDYKWSAEANYGIIPSDGIGGNDNITDLGIKYRFTDLGGLELGFSFNAGLSTDRLNESGLNVKYNAYYFQPRIFSEYRIPGMERFKTSLALGYSIVKDNTSRTYDGAFSKYDITKGGFNFNLGLSYDITDRFYIQTQYDFLRLKINKVNTEEGQQITPDFKENLQNIKLGVGLRF